MSDEHALMLVYLDNNQTDLAGNSFPATGFVKSEDFSFDNNLENGIFGILNGDTNNFSFEDQHEGSWAIVKTEQEQLIPIYPRDNKYKFKCGMVLAVVKSYYYALNKIRQLTC
jgi:hypothetical protein